MSMGELCGDILRKCSYVNAPWPVKLIGLMPVDCGDVVDVHAYPGPWPSAAARHRWYG